MSTQKKKPQKYQNKTAYKVQYDEKALQIHQKAPLDRLCKRCQEQIQWKIQFNKYKTPKAVSRCNKCGEKNIVKAYRGCCDSCSDKLKICSKCEQSKTLEPEPPKPSEDDKKNGGVDKKLLHVMEEYLETLRERSRRMILRKIKAELLTWKDGQFVYKADGKPLENLKFKKVDDEDLDDLDDLSDEDSPVKKTQKNPKKKEVDEDGFEDVSDNDEEDLDSGKIKGKSKKIHKKQKGKKEEVSDEDDEDFDDSEEEEKI